VGSAWLAASPPRWLLPRQGSLLELPADDTEEAQTAEEFVSMIRTTILRPAAMLRRRPRTDAA
jgi:hypothetical protein